MINSEEIFKRKKKQYVMIEGNRFFLTRVEQKTYLILDKCPHRGGPLSLGTLCEKTGGIQCPWHDNVIKVSALIKRSILAIRKQNRIFYT